jgi:putative acetyltransferase
MEWQVMIRVMKSDDVELVGGIWLRASLRSHDFVPAAFWRADHAVMVKEILPRATGFVHVTGSVIDGFITARDGQVDCLFVDPECQGQGIGRLLLDHAKQGNTVPRVRETISDAHYLRCGRMA